MTSKDRVRAFFARQPVDRVPINYYGNPDINRRMHDALGVRGDDHEGLSQRLGVDFHYLGAPYTGKRLHPEIPGLVVDPLWGFRQRYIAHHSGGYLEIAEWPLTDADYDRIAAWPLPNPDDFNYSALREQCQRWERFALHLGGAGTGDIINGTGRLRSMEQVLVDMMTDDPAGCLLFDRWVKTSYEIIKRSLEAVSDLVDFVWVGEDLGTQRGPLMSHDLFNRHIRPRLQPFFDLAKQYRKPVMVHSCGSSSWAFGHFIDMGATAVDTLQPEAFEMEPSSLKRRFGDRLAFHGMISTAGVLAHGKVDDVVRTVERTLSIMKPGGGYALAPTHMIQDNSPTENVVAMYETAAKCGKY